MKTLHWQSLTDARSAFHLAGNQEIRWHAVPLHDHDFAELFLVTAGVGLHRTCGGRVRLTRGQLVFMRPEHRHSLDPERGSGFAIINLAFPAGALDFLRTRYFPSDPTFWGDGGRRPQLLTVDDRQQEWLKAEFRLLERSEPTPLALDRFLLNLLTEVRPGGLPAPSSARQALPDWLARACARLRSPEQELLGPREFARLAGRSLEHVSRVLRARTGLTPTDFVNAVRLDRAAVWLMNGEKEILEIAGSCGFESVSHFYTCFRHRFGISPGRYRSRHRRVFG